MTDAELARLLAGRRVLIAYGLLGEVVSGLAPFGIDYMGAQIGWLRESLGTQVTVVRVPTAAPVQQNAERLAGELAHGPAVVIAHSKGGVEALAALTDPRAAANCEKLIAIQSPFQGSLVADWLLAAPTLRLAADATARLARLGSIAGILDLTTQVRAAWLLENEASLAPVLDRVVCCASWVDPADATTCGHYLPLIKWIERQGAGPNDGLVSVASALLPGTRHVLLQGTHRSLVATGPGREPIPVLRKLLAEALAPA